MEMTVKPLQPVSKHAGATKRPGAALGSSPHLVAAPEGRRRWPARLLLTFIDMIEPAVSRAFPGARFVAVQSRDHGLTFYRVSGRRTRVLGTSADGAEAIKGSLKRAKVRDVELRLDSEFLATASFKIPAAGVELANQIVASRLDRLTPWRSDGILHGFAMAPKPGPDGQVSIDFAATSKAIATAGVEDLAAFGLAASALGSAGEPVGQRLRIDLYGGRSTIAGRARRRIIGLLAASALAASAIACGISFHALNASGQRLQELDVTLAKARARLVAATGSTAARDQDFAYVATKTPDLARFRLIDRLAALLPDNTVLDALDIGPDEIRLAGTSTEASNLIRLLEDDPGFSDAQFSAPVTRQDGGRDRFEISLRYAAKPKEATQ